MKMCGWCGKEIEDDKCPTLWAEGKLVLAWHKKCDEDEKLTARIREIFANGVHKTKSSTE